MQGLNTPDRTRRIIRVDGSVEPVADPKTITQIRQIIGAGDSGLDTVSLRHLGRPPVVMLVDDLGHDKGRPVNPTATALYHANCVPGATHPIVGDVFIAPDSDFGSL